MADENTTQQDAPETNAPAGSTGADDLGTLLTDFDRQMGNSQAAAEAPTSEQSQEPVKPEASQDRDIQRDPATQESLLFDGMETRGLDRQRSPNDEVAGLRDRVQVMEAERMAERRAGLDKQSLAQIMREFAPQIAELKHLPPDLIALRLRAEEQINSELSHALAHRYDSEEAYQRAMTLSHRAVDRVVRDAARENARLDPENIALAHDRDLVTQAVMRAGGTPPAPKPVNIGKMSDRELAEYQQRNFGYVSKTLV